MTIFLHDIFLPFPVCLLLLKLIVEGLCGWGTGWQSGNMKEQIKRENV